MQVVPRCKILWIVRNLLNFSSTRFAPFHSTPLCHDRRKNFSKPDFKGGQHPSYNTERSTIRQKRADTKKAVKSLLFHFGDEGAPFLNDKAWKAPRTKRSETDSTRKRRSKPEPLRAKRIHNNRMRRNNRKRYFAEDDADCFDSWNGTSRRSSPRFGWREAFRGTNGGQEKTYKVNGAASEGVACNVGLPKDRTVLGLSPKGPLNMKDVKTAFHLSALKWHPDKHQGPTQAAAEEKFKLCVNAYKSLCSAVSGA